MKKIMSIMLIMILLMTAAAPSYAAGFTPPGLAKKGGLPPGIAKKFNDLSGFEWAMEAIERLAAQGILSGVGEGKFAPSNNVTKIEALTMIIRGLDWDDEVNLSSELIKEGKIKVKAKDKAKDKDKLQDWTEGYLEVAVNKGLISEADLTKQSFTTPATRQEVAMYIIRAMGLEAKAKEYTRDDLRFSDKAAVQSGAAGYVYLIDDEGIMKGYPDGTFRPNQPVKRAEMASLVATLNSRIDDDDDDDIQLINGKLVWLNTEKMYIERNAKIEGYTLDSNVKVYIDGKQKSLSDLKLDKAISLKLEKGIVKEIRWNADVVSVEASFNGYITLIYANDRTVVIKNGNEEKLFKIESNAEIKVDGSVKNFSNLKVGMKAVLKIIDGTVVSVVANTTTEEFTGKIIEINSTNKQIKIRVGNTDRTIQINNDTDIEVNNNDVTFDKLVVGMNVDVKIINGKVTSVYANSTEEVFSGKITAMNTTSKVLKVKVGNTERTVQTDSATDIELNGADVAFNRLAVGMDVVVRIVNEKVIYVRAMSTVEDFTGVIASINAGRNEIRIKIGSSERVIQVDSNTDIEIDGKDAALNQLISGMPVSIKLENQKVIRVYAESIMESYTGKIVGRTTGTENKLTLTINGKNSSFVVAQDAVIIDDEGDNIRFIDLVVGHEAEILVKNNIIVKIEMED